MDPTATKFAIFLGIVVVSIGCGWLVSTGLRLRETMGRVSLVVFLVLFALFPFVEKVVDGRPWYEALKWGIDLAGGTNLVYELEREPTDAGMMERMVGAIRRRVDPSGTQELAIRQVGKDRIEIIIPRASTESVARIKSQIQRVGSLEFHILANDKDHKDIIRRAQNVERDLYDSQKRLLAGWRPIKPKTVRGPDGKPKQVPNTEFSGERIDVRQIKGAEPGFNEVLVVYEPDPKLWVTGKYLRRAREGMDEGGRPAVDFSFDLKGASLFARLTSDNKPDSDGFRKHLAIILDDYIESAPTINSVISSNGQITGSFTLDEVKSLVSVLNAGALEVPLKKDPISEFTISPLLGVDVQTKGITAMIVATIAILVFMGIYYLWLGVISDICLLINLVLLIGTMAFIDATFTLPGLAGVVLTMGMAVDANVLIYERMREELERGASLRMSIQNGFSRAFSSIFDSNITTLLTAVILYMIGSDQVKGFAVTLFIGLAISMYTALTVNRLMLEIVERKRWLKQFRMCSVFGVTNFDFVGKQLICGIGSVVVIGAGLAAVGLRGESNLDIDFSGGTMVTVEFNESQNADDVRNKLEQAFKSDITLEELSGGHNEANAHKRFRIRTTDQDDVEVQKIINEAFPNQLKRNTMEYSKLANIPKAAEPKEGDGISPQKGDFPGGHISELTFSSQAAPDTMVRYFAASLAGQKSEKGEPLFNDADAAETFFSIRGAKEEEKKSEAGQMQRFSHMTLRTDTSIPAADVEKALAQMQQTLANSPEFDEVNNFESSVARETQQSAILAMIASLVMIVIYIWFRFQNVYFGLAAVLALLHDVLCTLGMVALASYLSKTPIGPYLLLSDFKINLTMIAAFLTIVGYSLNDTIVIFDRIREIRGKNPSFTRGMVNLAVNQTLSRTILTAGTVFITVVILYALGGEGIHGFAYAMLIGTVVGCYSTIYVASPFVLYLMEKYQKSGQTPQAAAPVGAART